MNLASVTSGDRPPQSRRLNFEPAYFLVGTLALLAPLILAATAAADLKHWYDRPAKNWPAGAVTVDLQWSGGAFREARLTTDHDTAIPLRLGLSGKLIHRSLKAGVPETVRAADFAN